MTDYIEERVKDLARKCIETHATVRQLAGMKGISKTTVHEDLAKRLPEIDKVSYIKVKKILLEHKNERHLRGGEATRQMYLKRMKRQ